MMHTLQAQVFICIGIHLGLPHQKTKRETSDASKSQLNQASSKKRVLMFGSENQSNVHNYLSIRLYDFPDRKIWKKSLHCQIDWVCAVHLEHKSACDIEE